ncbi:Hpt domain-containing protein [Methylobacter sp.]|uniref:Hpt domain-containing protein n=1 Tax=Methylobacter sp. TaxID=2051955 RepID=UPI002489E322|nr:Hpt domain-containing protein [Methylobacter sp.]MDI1276385.1 Hpt domain-containing protein [Methylobacter sp.]MDI1357185.1 Hpt domain-containing protein [Methylobacter sp.]
MNADFALLLAGMRDEFVVELPERCDLLEDGVLALEGGVASAFDELYRNVHSLKGAGGTFGLPLIARICHQFESFVSDARGRFDSLAVSYALSYVDLLRRVAEMPQRDGVFATAIEQDLEQLRISSMPGCAAVLLVEPSVATRKFCQGVLEPLAVRLVSQDRGLSALELLLHQPFDLLVAARELPDLNALALVAALRESDSRNKNIPVILISSNSIPAPGYLNIRTTIKRDAEFVSTLARCAGDVLASCSN